MKTLIVVRHAKSSWEEAGTDDHNRPLNDRGKKDAPEMAKRLRKRGIKIDLFLSSTARRASTTAQYFAAEYNVGKKDIQTEEQLYNAPADDIYSVVAALPDKHKNVAIFGHNPGITDFVNSLCQVRIDNMPTCAMYAVVANTDKWAQFSAADKECMFFDYPKNPQELK